MSERPCGVSVADARDGEAADRQDTPWQLEVLHVRSLRRTEGTLVHPKLVLTGEKREGIPFHLNFIMLPIIMGTVLLMPMHLLQQWAQMNAPIRLK